MATDPTIGNTILRQLDKNKMESMTGAKDWVFTERGLNFRIGKNPKGISHIRIVLNANDEYDIDFGRYQKPKIDWASGNCVGGEFKIKSKAEGIQVGQLLEAFKNHTGLDVRL